MTATATAPLLDVDRLRTWFHTEHGIVKAVDDVSLRIRAGHTLGLVGESGSGKSVTSLSIMGLLPKAGTKIDGGRIALLGQDLVALPQSRLRKLRGNQVSMIFQEPGTSLNPYLTAGEQVIETIRLHQKGVGAGEARKRAVTLFDEVGIRDPESRLASYPHQMSGGQKQRVMIAMALSCNPQLLIADEPTTALDVTIQAQILDLLRTLRDLRNMAVLFITHDLGVIAEIADDVAVMFRGRIVEYEPVERIFADPQHPYTKGLLACRPRLDTTFKRLPTVSDYMSTELVDGRIEMRERPMDDARLHALVAKGRGRRLHPRPVLERIGHPFAEGGHAADAECVPDDAAPLLSVRQLRVTYPGKRRLIGADEPDFVAVDGISFDVYPGQTLGLVGESGCGKTTTGRAILRLIPVAGGQVRFEGADLADLSGRALRELRQEMQMVFQDPYDSLNPRMTVERIVAEPMKIHGTVSRRDRRGRVADLLEKVGLSADHMRRYPHEFSGGQRQRICIARALALNPKLVVCDESVSALDVSVQAQVLNLLKDLQEELGLTYIFISHDLSVVKFMSDMMAVMKDGRVVEFGPSESIYRNPQQAYTRDLIAAIPDDSIDNIRRRQSERQAAQAGTGRATD